ncbi:unnamed protein product [Ambrosiozyma monospora]|uniref:Unnamed protein product n=1 Tax=Ambrosiozyma monospora TaxID=43982 RepID=A0ACB5T468_AMBMO|nr:unnamed protein product [Ambrosiozyma monospora]
MEQLNYGAIHDICFSDHKPVYGVFKCTVDRVNREKKNFIEKQLYEIKKAEIRNIINDYSSSTYHPTFTNEVTDEMANEMFGDDDDDDFLLGHGLPAPSTNERKWWNNGGLSTRARFPELDEHGMRINPDLPKNPFKITRNDQIFLE